MLRWFYVSRFGSIIQKPIAPNALKTTLTKFNLKHFSGTKDDRPVTIKFVPNTKITESEREFELFKYLDAYNNPKVERFGIPSIYFHDQWQNYTVTAFTRLEQTLWQLGDEGYFSYESFDIMLLFKQFVSLSPKWFFKLFLVLIEFSFRLFNPNTCIVMEFDMTTFLNTM